MYSVYVLYSKNYDKYYVGHSNDTDRRLKEHNDRDGNRYTTKYIPWKLLFVLDVSKDRGKAIKLEKFIKAQKSKAFILRFISERELQESLIQRFG